MSVKKKLGAPLIYFGLTIGLIPFRLGEDQSDLQFSIVGVVYGTILSFAYGIVFVMAMYMRYVANFPLETPLLIIADGIALVVEYCVCTATWLTFARSQERIGKMLQDLFKIQEFAWKYFGIPTDYERIIHQITVHATWINFVFFIFTVLQNALSLRDDMYSFPIWILFSLPLIVHHNVIILFLASMAAIRRKFHLLNQKLIDRGRSIDSSRCINDFAYVHGLLCDLAESVSHFFSHLILLIVIRHFLQFIVRIYTVCMFLKSTEYTYLMAATLSMQFTDLIVGILQEYFIGSIVDGTVKEARNTGNALHEMANEQRPLRQRTQVYAFSIQLLRRRLELSAHGFFKFDLTLTSKVISTATTYVIIMMQLENFNPNVPSAQSN